MFIIFHSGWDPLSPDVTHAAPEASAKVVKDFPGLKIILAHLGGLKMWQRVYDALPPAENLYLDTAMLWGFQPDKKLIKDIIEKHPYENVIFGSDCPWEDPANNIKFIDSLDISDDRKEAIYHINAQRLIQ